MAIETDYREVYFDRRINLLDNILGYTRETKTKGRDFWAIKKDKLRFFLGETELDIKVPFIFGGESEEVIDDAIKELFSLVKGRLEPPVVYDRHGGLMISVLDEKVPLMTKGYRVGSEFTESIEKESAVLLLYSDSIIDAGLIASWLSPNLQGKRLIRELHRIYRKSIEEEMRLGGDEKTSFLTHLAVSNIINEKKEQVKDLKITGMNYEKLERSISIFFFSIIYSVISDIFSTFRGKQLSYDLGEMEYLLLGSLTPFFVLNIKSSILKSDINPYNITPKIAAKLDEVYGIAAKKSTNVSDLISKLTTLVMKNRTLTETIFEFYSISKFRDDILDYLIRFDNQRDGINILLSEIAQDNKLLQMLWEDSMMASQVELGLTDVINRFNRDEERIQKVTEILAHFKTHRKWGLVRIFSQGKEGIEFKLTEVLKRYVVYRMDQGYDSYLTASKRALQNRKKRASLKELISEYEKGRLYRFSGDHKLSLMKKEDVKEAHLYVDLKGFTRRTQKSGSHVMAEFLKNEFFVPILESARGYYIKVGGDSYQGLELNNLLGDALTFSGELPALMELAREIQRITREYKQKLIKNNPDFDEKAKGEKLRKDYQKELMKLSREGKKIVNTILGINKIVEAKMGISPQVMIENQVKSFDEDIQRLISALGKVSSKVKKVRNRDERKKFIQQEEDLRSELQIIQSAKEELLKEVKKQGLIMKSQDFYKEVSNDELRQIRRLKGMLSAIYKRERELTQSYYERQGEIADLGVNTGLYISFGGVTEIVHIDDELWGDIKVSIADKINESARGASRNSNIKKRVDRFVERTRFEMANTNLIYPFNVIVSNNYSIIQPIDEQPNIFQRGQESFLDYAENLVSGEDQKAIISSELSSFSSDEELINLEFISKKTDIYNLGEALSGDALREYIRVSSSRLSFFEKRVLIGELNPEFIKYFAYDGLDIYLIFGVEHKLGEMNVEIFRYAGAIDYAGTLKQEVTEVYEMIWPNSPFFNFIMDNHFDKWYKQSKESAEKKEENELLLNQVLEAK